MHIIAVCPRCGTSYQLQPSLRGQAVRCPNTNCRQVFRIGNGATSEPAPAPAPTPKSGKGQQTGAVGDLVPVLPAEEAEVLPEVNEKGPSWRDAAPPVRKPGAAGARPAAATPAPPPAKATPQPDGPSWRDAPPPVRQGGDAPDDNSTVVRRRGSPADTGKFRSGRARAQETLSESSPEPIELPYAEDQPEAPAPRVSRRTAKWAMILISLVVLGALGVGGYIVWRFLQKSETELTQSAGDELKENRFSSAAEQWENLAKSFPDSQEHEKYVFLADWSRLAARLNEAGADPAVVVPALEQFLREKKLDQFLKEKKADPHIAPVPRQIGQSLVKVAEGLAQRNAVPSSAEPLQMVSKLEQARTAVRKAVGKEGLEPADDARFRKALDAVREAVRNWELRNNVLAYLKALKPGAASIRAFHQYVREKTPVVPGLATDPQVTRVLQDLEEGHKASVVWEPSAGGESPPPRTEDRVPSVVFEPLLAGTPGGAPADDPVRLAVARGVLYALRESNGTVKWARRVGIDTTMLPVRVKPTASSRERFLVVSSDSLTLTALDADGRALWQYALSKACLGRPLVIDERGSQRAYLATYDGIIHEIELARGTLLGKFKLGQPLTVGGAREPGTNRLYFPADDSCVYVLDVSERAHRCELVLYSGHPSGSVRSEPVVIPSYDLGQGEGTPGYLVLNQADGLDGVRLRVYELPLSDAHTPAKALDPDPRLPGWTWFPPRQDAEKLIVLSDRGTLGLFGIRQPKNKDQPLFPLLSQEGLDLRAFLGPKADGADAPARAAPTRGRAEVVHAQGEDFWPLANGRLQRISLAWSARRGLEPTAGWDKPLDLGSPLHESEVSEGPRQGQATLFVVSQPLDQQICVATAVDDEDGHIRWQRQLGLVCQGEPIRMQQADGPPVLLALDQGGCLFSLDPTRFPLDVTAPWQGGGHNVAGALTDNPRVPAVLLAAADGKTAYEIACPGDSSHLLVRTIDFEPTGRRLRRTERSLPLTAPLAGTPTLVGQALVLPLASGTVARLALPVTPASRIEEGPDWRERLTPPDARGHVVGLAPDLFLVTDGRLGMTCYRWPADMTWSKAGYLEVKDRITAAPAVLPDAAGSLPRLVVPDAGGTLTLVAVRAEGVPETKRSWDLHGGISGSPFVRMVGEEPRVGCLVDGRRLVWLAPNKDEVLWEHKARGTIVGHPDLAEGLVVVADLAGTVVALDPKTGTSIGEGFGVPGSIVPAASPVSFGLGRVFAPLSDGTALLLTTDRLSKR